WNKMDNDEAGIVAAADGVIIYKNDGNTDRSCSFNSNNWNAVYVRHADGTVSWYGHMKRNSLTTKAVGQTVSQGEYLGIVGSSGNSTGPHLHFEIYSPTGQLQDPFQGTCNLMNNFSYWANQPEYRDSKINKLMTHSAPPNFSTCPNPETPNEKTSFQPGDKLIVAAYYRDQQIGQQSQLSLIQPNGAVYSNWTHNSPNTYAASYWYWTFTLPNNAMPGTWKFRANYQSTVYEQPFTVQGKGKTPFDFDGDSRTDISIYRPTAGEWWYLRSSDGGNRAFQFGSPADKIVPADYTGDGKTDVAFFRPATSEWFILRSEDSSFYSFPFGAAGDIPAPADFDGDGKADAAVFRPSTATWFVVRSSGGTTIQQFGAAGDIPVLGDYDGDSKADLAIYRPAVGEWWFLRSSDGGNRAFQFGTALDKPVQSDYTGDGKTDVAFFRPATAEWFVLRSENGSFYSAPFGASGDIPIPGDYDGDGKSDFAVWRSSDTNWYAAKSSGGFSISAFGSNGDKPVPSAFVP
ncbi:MAG TPA: FG-GAP-like repeat-containing protein, partial [Pyrinomonadaceae bacterium]|nr:FG-GAP-like repeat-containing protein [Pyrinomonadaceae bacterium]